MISGLIYVSRPAVAEAVDRLADTLTALVEGVASGLVADAAIISGEVSGPASEALGTVAEASGARLLRHAPGQSPWRAGARAARRDWVLCLEAGDVLREGWIRTLDRFVNTARPEVVLARLGRPHAGIRAGLLARAERVIGAREPRAGDLVRRAHLIAASPPAARLRVRPLTAQIERA